MNTDLVLATLCDLANFLDVEEIDYALMGGLAVAVRGEPRSTLDVDVVLACDVDRALVLLKSLGASRFKPYFDGVEEVIRTGLLLPLEHRETAIRIDLSIGMSGFDRDAIAQSTQSTMGGRSIPVVAAEYLVVMKQLASRPRDLEDIKSILLRQGVKFDWNLALRLARELGQAVDDDLYTPLENLRSV